MKLYYKFLMKQKQIIFSLILFIFLIFSCFISAHFVMKSYYAKKEKYLFQNYDQLNFYAKYLDKLHHLRGPDPGNKTYTEVHQFLFNYLNKDTSKTTVLIQGDSRSHGLNSEEALQALSDIGFINKFNIINAGTTSYSISPMLVQLDILKNDFKIEPEILVSFVDPTDIGDDVCRYKDLLKYDNNGKIVSLSREPNNGNIYWYDYTLLGSKINLYEGFKSRYLLDLLDYIITDRIFQGEKTCGFGEIQKPLINQIEESNVYFKKLIVEYIEKAFSSNKLKKLYFVTYPHVQHYSDKAYGVKYQTKISDLVNEVIAENNLKNKIYHINLYDNDIFPEMNNNFFEYFIEGDHGSHLTKKGKYIFINYIFSKIN